MTKIEKVEADGNGGGAGAGADGGGVGAGAGGGSEGAGGGGGGAGEVCSTSTTPPLLIQQEDAFAITRKEGTVLQLVSLCHRLCSGPNQFSILTITVFFSSQRVK